MRRCPSSPLSPPLRQSSRRQGRTITPSVRPSPSEVIEVKDVEAGGSTVEEEEAEVSVPRRRASQDPCLRDLISDFKAAVERAFNLTLLGDALMDAVKNVAKVPLNIMRVKAASALSDKLGGILTEILALVRQREGLTALDLAAEVQSLVREYRAKVEVDRQDLVRKMAEEDARIS